MQNYDPIALYPPILGGFGLVNVVPSGTPVPDEPVKAEKPLERTGTGSTYGGVGYGPGMLGFGRYPGFSDFPTLLTDVLAYAMRHYPMVAKVHARVTKPVLASTRSVEIVSDNGKPDLAGEIREAAQRDLLPAFATAAPGMMEAPCFGKWLQESVWDKCEKRTVPIDFLPVLPFEGQIYVDDRRRFSGYTLNGHYRDARYALLAVHDRHWDTVLGHSPNQAALTSWHRANKSAQNADAVERKNAGIQMIAQVMQGVQMEDSSGNPTPLMKFIRQIVEGAKNGQSAVIPGMHFDKGSIQAHPELAKVPLLHIDKFDWGNLGPAIEAHLSRKREMDIDICSAWGVPERAVMEAANHGGYADAIPAGDVVIDISEQLHSSAVAQFNAQVTDRWLAANYAKTGIKVRLVANPMTDQRMRFREQLILALAANKDAASRLLPHLDPRKLLEQDGVPLVSEEDAAKIKAEADAAAMATARQPGNMPVGEADDEPTPPAKPE